MAKCEICNKATTFGIQISHSHRRSNRTWKPNIQRVRAMVDGSPRRINVCSKCLKSGKVDDAIKKIDEMFDAKEKDILQV